MIGILGRDGIGVRMRGGVGIGVFTRDRVRDATGASDLLNLEGDGYSSSSSSSSSSEDLALGETACGGDGALVKVGSCDDLDYVP